MFRIDLYLAVRVVHCVYLIDIERLDFVGRSRTDAPEALFPVSHSFYYTTSVA